MAVSSISAICSVAENLRKTNVCWIIIRKRNKFLFEIAVFMSCGVAERRIKIAEREVD